MIRVFVVDDHELVRRGLIELLSSEDDIEVVGEAATAAQARGRIGAVLPDIAVLDVRLPDGSGIDVCRSVRAAHPEVRCLMLTAYSDEDALYAAVIAGAAGYVLKDIRGTGLVDSIRKVAHGRTLLDHNLVAQVSHRMRGETREEDPRLKSLSARERQILALIANGLTNRQIGDQLSLAEKTVKNYVSSLLSKLGLERRTQAAVLEVRSQTL
jgi:DNA-binding NarL/FixJ family response regulator